MAEAKRVGVAVSERVVRGVVVDHHEAATVVEKPVEVSLSRSLTQQTLLDGPAVEELSGELARQFDGVIPAASEWVVALPTGFCRVRVTPVDGDLVDDEIAEHARWELSQAIADDLQSYNFGVERIRADIGLTDRAVVVGVRKDLAAALQKLLAPVAGRIAAMEADVFSAARAFEHNYEADAVRPTLLLGREGGLFHGLVLVKNAVTGYAAWPIGESVGEEPSEIAAFVRDIIDRYLKAHEICASLEELAGIYLYGERVDEDLLEALRDTCEARVERLNPFQRYRPAAEAETDVSVEAHPEAFATAFGAALW